MIKVLKTWEMIKLWQEDNSKEFKCLTIRECDVIKSNNCGQLSWNGKDNDRLLVANNQLHWKEIAKPVTWKECMDHYLKFNGDKDQVLFTVILNDAVFKQWSRCKLGLLNHYYKENCNGFTSSGFDPSLFHKGKWYIGDYNEE